MPAPLRVSSLKTSPTFVAITTSSRNGSSACPRTRSAWPQPYASAVSNSRTPPSYATRIAAIDTSSSTSPQPAGAPANSHGPPSAHVPAPRAGICHWPTVRRVDTGPDPTGPDSTGPDSTGPDSIELLIATSSKSTTPQFDRFGRGPLRLNPEYALSR